MFLLTLETISEWSSYSSSVNLGADIHLTRFSAFLRNNGDLLRDDSSYVCEVLLNISGNVRTFVTYDGVAEKGSRDHLVEHLPPVASYGTKFAMMTTPGRTVGDVYKIVSSKENTGL